VTARNAEGPDTDARPCHCERQSHTTEDNPAFASERSGDVGRQRRTGDLVPAGYLLVSVMRELFAKADVFEDGDE
jgi:hypothetical protein